jgi:hypothetical protein
VLDGIIKLGVDIYGTHYLVSIDKAKGRYKKMEENVLVLILTQSKIRRTTIFTLAQIAH